MPTESPTAAGTTAPLEAPESGSTFQHVLVVEDEEELADLWEYWLEGFYGDEVSIYTTHTLAEATATLESLTALDLAILDRQLPDGTGDDLLAPVKERFDAVTVMITAVPPESDLINLQVDDYIVKPIDEESLFERFSLLEKLDAANVLSHYSDARKASLLEHHLDDPESDPLFRRFAARWSYDRLEIARVHGQTFVYELYVGTPTADAAIGDGEVSVSISGSLGAELEDLLESGTVKPVGELFPDGDGYSWIGAKRKSRLDAAPDSIGIYEFTCDAPEQYITEDVVAADGMTVGELRETLENEFN